MKSLITLFGVLLFIPISYGQDNRYKVLTGTTDTLQYHYFMARLQEQFAERRKAIKKASRTKKKLIQRRDLLRARFKEMIGLLPHKHALEPHVTRKIEMDSYTVETITFESLPNHHVTGLFYLPKTGKSPFPGVYIPCGHSRNGKANESYQKAARLFATHGFAVLQADPICQGERYQLLDKKGDPLTSGGTLMHEFFGQALALTGSSTLEHELYDNIRCLDFLEQHPMVDGERLAVAGNSGGGTQTTYLVAYDRRIKVATPSCFIATKEQKMRTHGIGDFCQHLWGEGYYSMEEQDFLFMAAPIPVKILSTKEDFFPVRGAKIAYLELARQYQVLGIPEKVGHSICEGPHGWLRPNREASVQWCKRWLTDDHTTVSEPDNIGYFPDDSCLATFTGQVLSTFKYERSLFDLIENRIEECRKQRRTFMNKASDDNIRETIKHLIGFEEPSRKTVTKEIGSWNERNFQVTKLLLTRDKKHSFYLPALLMKPERIEKGIPAILIIHEGDKDKAIDRGFKEVDEGKIVLLVDISDTGELEDKKSFRASWSTYFTAKFPLYEGKTLVGYQTEDIVIAARYLLSHHLGHKNKLKIVSSGKTGYAAIHAAVISGFFDTVEIDEKVKDWEMIALEKFQAPQQLSRMDILVPDVLSYYDLPDLEKWCFNNNIRIIRSEK